ncbi:alkaline phosphatase PafA [Segetibacter aerophilus]|uniref:Alkaline phosphatase family protein n=1 Tax=Segetibacter aerophilus TaxID=670293 RepID=A0A512BI71_9BACT|nr:alkaline phosphatase PafA [Segetibacter aerophilus]GEO11668.1 alkaline phosphatase family protein [Segetibacter aerophilus]
MRNIVFVIVLLVSLASNAQKKTTNTTSLPRPKLVVGIVIDQMRWDYLYRYSDRYSSNGFKRILNEGYTCENTFIPYTPTVTAAGHTCVYTGSVPAIHGIMGNNWYRRDLKRSWYCTEDTTFKSVGSTSDAGEMSPSSMLTTTVTDELRMATNYRSKVIGIALKDRGAILPAGHSANGAYWFDNANGAFITSSYYMKDLPDWLKQFNSRKLPDQYLQQNWNTLYPINTYVQSTADDKSYEGSLEDNTFPHITANITRDKYNAVRITPFGNTLTFEMAKAAVEGERLGQTGNTDFLAVSFSSPDYIGHTFGPNSIEAEDNYLRLDNELGQFLNYLDGKVGKGQYTVFITADHAAAHVPEQLRENKIPAGTLNEVGLLGTLNDLIDSRFKIKNAVSSVMNFQVYLNRSVVGEDEQKIKEAIIERLLENPAIVMAFDLKNTNTVLLPAMIKNMVTNGYNQKLSGDIQFVFKPQYFSGGRTGTTHGSWNPYDSHIPLLWYGWGIKKGKTNRETYMTDISATLSALLHIQMPSGNIGHVIEEVMQ